MLQKMKTGDIGMHLYFFKLCAFAVNVLFFASLQNKIK
jgi:hypothetical protein